MHGWKGDCLAAWRAVCEGMAHGPVRWCDYSSCRALHMAQDICTHLGWGCSTPCSQPAWLPQTVCCVADWIYISRLDVSIGGEYDCLLLVVLVECRVYLHLQGAWV